MKSLIFIGPDGVGKSTLAQDMSERFVLPVYHGRGVHEDKVVRSHVLTGWTHQVIFDRIYPIDDLVYSRALGFEPNTQLTHFMSALKDPRRFIIIYVDNKAAEQIISERGDEDGIESSNIPAIRKAYDEVLKLEGFANVLRVNMNFELYPEVVEELVRALRKMGFKTPIDSIRNV